MKRVAEKIKQSSVEYTIVSKELLIGKAIQIISTLRSSDLSSTKVQRAENRVIIVLLSEKTATLFEMHRSSRYFNFPCYTIRILHN